MVCLRTEGPRRPVCVSLFGLDKRTIHSLRRPRRVKTTKAQEPLNNNFRRGASPSCDPPPSSSCRSKVPPPPPQPPAPPSPPPWIRAGTQTQQSVQEVRPVWQTAELSWRVRHMAATCGSALPLRKIQPKLDFIYFFDIGF